MHSPQCGGTTEDVRGGVLDHVIDLKSRWKSAPTKYHCLKLKDQECFHKLARIRKYKMLWHFYFFCCSFYCRFGFLLQNWFDLLLFSLAYVPVLGIWYTKFFPVGVCSRIFFIVFCAFDIQSTLFFHWLCDDTFIYLHIQYICIPIVCRFNGPCHTDCMRPSCLHILVLYCFCIF